MKTAKPTTVPTEVPRCEADEEAAENFRKGFNAGVEAERERCAGVADTFAAEDLNNAGSSSTERDCYAYTCYSMGAHRVAAAIRALPEKGK